MSGTPFDPEVTFTRLTRTDGGLLTKTIRPDGKGGIVKTPAAAMTAGTAETVALPFSEFGTYLRSLKPEQALAHGVCGRTRANIVSAAKFTGQPNTVTRSKEYFHYPDDGWACAMLDHDPAPGQDALSPAQLFDAVAAVWPAFADLPKVVTGSTSAYIFDATGKQLTGRGSGFHAYFPFKPASALPDLAEILSKRIWLTGHGYIAISRAGSMLVRTVFDKAVFSPERIDFCAGAHCIDCAQRLPAPDHHPGRLQEDAEVPLPRPLTPTEEAAFNALVAVAKEQARPAAEKVRAAREKQEIKILQEKRGIDPEAAAAIVKARHEGRLEPGDFIQFQDGRLPAVAEILASPEQYHGQPCADPLEPEYGTGKAKLFVNDSGSIVINSFLHGGQTYMLRQPGGDPGDPQTDFAGLGDHADQEQPAAIDPAALLGRYEVKTEYVERLGKEEFLIENLLVRGHILVVIAMSGGGKTAFWYRYAAPVLARKGMTVWYLDADSPASEHKAMKEIADRHKFRFLNPDANVGAGIAEMKKDLEKIANGDHDLTGHVFIIDTLKKFTDLMSKGSVKDFFTLCRKLTSKGATVVLLGHANKYRSKPEGHLIAEGVGDVRSDTDELIFFERKKNENTGGLDITTDPDPDHGAKVRGIFRPFSFHIGPDREVTLYDKPVDMPDHTLTATPTATEEEIIDAAAGFLAEAGEPVAQSTLVGQVRAMVTAGRDRVRALIVANSMKAGSEGNKRFVYTIGARGRLDYSLPQRAPEQGEMFETEASFRRESSFLS